MPLTAAQKSANVAQVQAAKASTPQAGASAPSVPSNLANTISGSATGSQIKTNAAALKSTNTPANSNISKPVMGGKFIPGTDWAIPDFKAPTNNPTAPATPNPDQTTPPAGSGITGISGDAVIEAGAPINQAGEVATKYGIPGVDSTISAAIKTKLAEQQRQKESLASITNQQNALDQSKVDQATQGLATQGEAATAKYAQGQEGPQSNTRAQLVGDIHTDLATQKSQILQQQEITTAQRDNAQKELAYAQQQGNQQLAEYWGAKMQGAQDRLDQIALNKAQMEHLQRSDDMQAITTLGTLVSNGQIGSADQLLAYANSMGLPPAMQPFVTGLWTRVQQINASKDADTNYKKALTDQAVQDFKDQLGGYNSDEGKFLRLWENIKDDPSIDDETKQFLKDKAGGALFAKYKAEANNTQSSSGNTFPLNNTAGDFNSWSGSFASGDITQDFDTPDTDIAGRTTHQALDIPGKANTPVGSPVSGKVVKTTSAKNSGWGNSVDIKDADGNTWKLAHFNELNLKEGDTVGVGEVVGLLGSTGHSTGPHVHIEVTKPNGTRVDPRTMFTGQSMAPIVDSIYNDAPADLKKDKDSRATLRNDIAARVSSGESPNDVRNSYLGYNIYKKEDKAFADGLASYTNGTKIRDNMSELANLVNGGNYATAITTVENERLKNTDKTTIKDANSAALVMTKVSRANKLLQEVGAGYIGPFDTKLQQFTIKTPAGANSTQVQKSQELASLLTELSGNYLHNLSGAAVTTSEADRLDPILASMRDQPWTIATKLSTFKNTFADSYNTSRINAGLPSLENESQIANPLQRKSLYEKVGQNASSQNTQQQSIPAPVQQPDPIFTNAVKTMFNPFAALNATANSSKSTSKPKKGSNSVDEIINNW